MINTIFQALYGEKKLALSISLMLLVLIALVSLTLVLPLVLSLGNILHADAPMPWQIGFQDSASQSLAGMVELHDNIFFFLILILIGVLWLLGVIVYLFKNKSSAHSEGARNINKYWNHGTAIELVWTVTPALILLVLAQPSFSLLYILDEVISPALTIKVTGSQWYWSFEYSDYEKESGDTIEFDSYMVPEADLELGQLRNLEVDNKVKLPVDTHVRFIVTASDVIHSYAVPSLGLKVDAVPGRLNQASTLADREGIFYGQCSEICGVYHGFMPTAVESLPLIDYLTWIENSD